MTSASRLALLAIVGVAACSDASQDPPLAPATAEVQFVQQDGVRVTNSQDAGAGSFRAAVAAANADPSVRAIAFGPHLDPILVLTPVVYTGEQALGIEGNGAVLDGSALEAAAPAVFVANGGGDLSVGNLTVRNAPQEGLVYQVPGDASGTRKVRLVGVEILGNKGHGVLINDQVDPVDVTNSAGSDASLEVSVVGSRFADNGFGGIDRDGLRVNEGGNGTLDAVLAVSHFEHNGADGVELDERGAGDAVFKVSATQITRNGSYDVTLTDLDDGMDVDEAGEGALIGQVTASAANDNFEEGWDFNENDAGDFRVDMTLAEASRNLEEGFDFEEDDDFQGGGDLITTLIAITADGNGPGGDAGLKIRERGDGNLDATVRGARANGNLTAGINLREQGNGDLHAAIDRAISTGNGLAGISVREDDAGSLAATITRPAADGNTGQGIDFDENGTGDLTAAVSRGSAANNGGAGVKADQQLVSGAGVGTLDLIGVTLTGNIGGAVVNNAGVTVTQTP